MAGMMPIVSDRVGSKDLIAEGVGAVLPADTPARWTDAIEGMLSRIHPKQAPLRSKPNRMQFSFESALKNTFAS